MDPIGKLLDIINSETHDSTHVRVATYIIQNMRSIESFTISQFAEATYVSAATVTRFIQFIGFNNYGEFRAYFSKIRLSSRHSFLKLNPDSENKLVNNPQAFLSEYISQITASLYDTVETLSITDIDYLINEIMNTENVAILGYSDSNAIAKDIQLGFAAHQKIIEVAQNTSKFEDIIKRYDKDSLIIILSNYGNFFSHFRSYYQHILTKNIPIICITQNYNSMDVFIFKKVIYLNSKRMLGIGNYSMRLFSEFLVRRLIYRPKHPEN